MASPSQHHELRRFAREALLIASPVDKVEAVSALIARQRDGDLACDTHVAVSPVDLPGRPERPVLVPSQDVPKRRLSSPKGRAALVHAIAHIEFNAINLALDAIARFADMPEAYYTDWLRVAVEEAQHFSLLSDHLRVYDHRYGDLPAHNGLWEMAQKTAADVMTRMALVPRVLEARGLDVTPGMQARLRQAGDAEAADILDIILREEIGHVATGNRWFHYLCANRALDPLATFEALCRQHDIVPMHPPINEAARIAAGFSAEELRLAVGGRGPDGSA